MSSQLEAQRAIAASMVSELSLLWPLLDFHDLRGTTGSWLKAVRPVVERAYLVSQFVAFEGVVAARSAAVPLAPRLEPEVPNPLGAFGFHASAPRDTQLRIMASMKFTGPGCIAAHSTPGITVEQMAEVSKTAMNKSNGAAIRLALNGGRGMVRMLLDADPEAVGIRSVAREDACAPCYQLSTLRLMKGVHTSRQLDAVAVGHDSCFCVAELIYPS